MLRQLTRCVLPTLVCVSILFGVTHGQQSGQKSSPSLSQRLEQFRDDVLGDTPSSARRKNNPAKPTPAKQAVKVQQGIPIVKGQPGPTTAKGQQGATAAPNSPAAAIDSGSKEPTQPTSARPSSRRTAQPGYAAPEPKLAKPAADAAAAGDEIPHLAKPQSPTPAKRRESTEAATPRVARSVQSDAAMPEPVKKMPEPVKKQPAETPHERTEKPAKVGSGDNILFSGQSPQLSVEAIGPRKVLIGREATFVVKLRNGGASVANNVVVTINIPAYAEVVAAQPTAGNTRSPSGTDRAEPFEWRVTRLEAHSHEALNLKIIPRKSIPIDLAVQWTCSPETSQTLVEVQEPKLVMSIVGPSDILYGQSKVYKLTMSNPGNGDAENMVVSLLPMGRSAEGSASHKLGTLRAGESKAIEVELTARQSGSLAIRAQAFADGGLRAEVAQEILVRRANLKLNVEGPKVKYAGTTGTYRVHLINAGDAVAEKVQIAAMLPPEAKYVGSNAGGRVENDRGKVLWNAGTLQPNGERIFEVQCTLLAPGDNRMQIITTAEDNLSASASAATRVEALADLKLEVRDPQGPVPVGEDTVYEIVIRNRGTKAADNINLVVFFSQGLEATAVEGGPHDIGRGQVVFKTIPSLAAGSETIYRVHARADRAGNHVFRSEVVCESLQTKLAAEETTRFYGDEATPEREGAGAAAEDVPDLQPVPN